MNKDEVDQDRIDAPPRPGSAGLEAADGHATSRSEGGLRVCACVQQANKLDQKDGDETRKNEIRRLSKPVD